MKQIDKLEEIKESFSLVIGNFDGVHVGHQEILKKFTSESSKSNLKTCILTFNPHPLLVIDKDRKDFLLQSYKEKKQKLSTFEIDYYYEVDFCDDVSHLDGESFFKKFVLVNQNLKKVFPGHDFCLGANRSFDLNDLKDLLNREMIQVETLGVVKKNDFRVSSSQIREFLKEGRISEVNKLLGENYSLSGEVIHGLKNGRKINFPTINLSYDYLKLTPKSGVYKTNVEWKGKVYKALTNIGNKPTVGNHPISVETYLLNFDSDIYDEKVKIDFIDFIRDEKKFKSFEELKEQISKDLILAWD